MAQNFRVFPIAPSSPFDQEKYERGVALLQARGFAILHEATARLHHPSFLNGSDEERTKELLDALASTSSQLMWMARGGYGLTRLLPLLELPQTAAPALIGFSDTTALHCHLWKHRRQKGIHGPNIANLSGEDGDALGTLWSILEGRACDVNWPTLSPLYWPKHYSATGPLIVANLCVLTHLIGTTSMPDLSGTLLVLEDIGERPYRIDRMLTQLWNSGALAKVKAIALGHFSDCNDAGDKFLTAHSIIEERCRFFDIPLCKGLPVGHDVPNWAIPFGAQARLELNGDAVLLHVLEELF